MVKQLLLIGTAFAVVQVCGGKKHGGDSWSVQPGLHASL